MRIPLLVVAALLSGCASIDKAKGHSEVSDLVDKRTGRKTGWAEGSPGAAALDQQIDKLLEGGLTREKVMALALLNNKELQGTYEELGVSQADMVQAGLLANPSLSGSVGFPAAEGIIETEFELVHQLLDLIVLPMRKRIAAEQFAADVSRVANEAVGVAAHAAAELAELQAAQKQLELQRLIVDAAKSAKDLAEKQHAVGNLTELELAEQRADYAEAKLTLSRDEQAVIEAREGLNRHLGLFGPRAQWKLAAELPELPREDPPLDKVEARSIRERLDIDASRKVADLMTEATSLARTTRFAGLVSLGVHTHQDPDGPRLIGPSLEIELPIFDQRQAVIARLEAEQRVAQRKLEALSVQVRADVRVARSRLQLARATVDYYRRELLPLREKVVEQTQLQYNAMQIGLYALLASKREQAHAYREYLEAVRDYWVARASLEAAVGGALEGPVSEKPVETIVKKEGGSHEHH